MFNGEDLGNNSTLCIGVVGAGNMGIQVAECFIEHGYSVILKTRNSSRIDQIVQKIKKHLLKRGDSNYLAEALSHLVIADSYSALSKCNVVIESVVEDYQVKCEVFSEIKRVVREGTVVVTNTSALSVTKLGLIIPQLAGFHFFNPISRMKLVEIVISAEVRESTVDFLKKLVTSLNKVAIVVQDSPGFLVNRLLLPQINNAIKMYETGVASKEEIDTAIKLGLNHSMGPFELADFIGLDVCYSILIEMYEVSGDPNYYPAATLKDLVNNGALGFKTRSGFYTY